MKREGSDHHLYHLHHSLSVPMANCALTLLSDHAAFSSAATRMFECKTCNRQFSSFQALGGHRASHKKPRIMAVDGDNNNNDGSSSSSSSSSQSAAKPKTHECSICGLEFAIGQALGGHMRRHRVPPIISDHNNINSAAATKKNNKKVDVNGDDDDSKRLSSLLFLDLNLTPSQNHLEFLRIASNPTSTATPLLDCFY